MRILATPLNSKEHIAVLDDIIADRLAAIDLTTLLVYLIDTVPVDFLDDLAKQFDIEGYKGFGLATTELQKRTVLKSYIELHRYKGTVYALKKIFTDLGFPLVEITERPAEYSGSYPADEFPFTFKVVIKASDYTDISTASWALMKGVIAEYKNARSTLVPSGTVSYLVEFSENASGPVSESLNFAAGLSFSEAVAAPTETPTIVCTVNPVIVQVEATNFINTTQIDNCKFGPALHKLVTDLKAITINGVNIWTSIQAIYPFVSDGILQTREFQHSKNLKAVGSFPLTFTGAPTHDDGGILWNGGSYGTVGTLSLQDPEVVLGIGNVNDFLVYVTQSNIGTSPHLQPDVCTPNNHLSTLSELSGGELAYYGQYYHTGQALTWNRSWANNSDLSQGSGCFSCRFYRRENITNDTYFSDIYKNSNLLWASSNTHSSEVQGGGTVRIGGYLGGSGLVVGSIFSEKKHGLVIVATYPFESSGANDNKLSKAAVYTAIQAFQTALGRNV